MKRLQNATLCVIGVMSVMALYLAARSPSKQLADVAARLDAIEARLAAREELDMMHASLASDIDSQGVIRSAEGNVIGHWGIAAVRPDGDQMHAVPACRQIAVESSPYAVTTDPQPSAHTDWCQPSIREQRAQ